ncbi:MAG: UvrB/UvrC motif-containing protein [Kiritimatiellae bacterium]|nr:UvrB/UvrC motif-containing protein [Kiritimatiellia bacterium]MBR1835752.1 UvrB/UvrC motif-containing protein [Kiritimatiellia bacterium]
MKCEICHLNDAARAVERYVDGERRELFVCDDCARKSASPPSAASEPRSVTDVLFSLGMPVPPNSRASGAACPVCGMERGEVRRTHRLGCPRCYETFEQDIRTFLSEQVPAEPRSRENPDEAMRERAAGKLERELEKAVREERYEEAARLQASLRSLRRRVSGGNSASAAE